MTPAPSHPNPPPVVAEPATQGFTEAAEEPLFLVTAPAMLAIARHPSNQKAQWVMMRTWSHTSDKGSGGLWSIAIAKSLQLCLTVQPSGL